MTTLRTLSAMVFLVLASGCGAIIGPDSDGDGLSDQEEARLLTDPLRSDTDSDGLPDGDELARGTDPLNPDTDGDGLLDGDEVARGFDPLSSDADGDGLNDFAELALGTDPRNSDSDSDGLSDWEEAIALGSDPLSSDSDGDGLSDSDEVLLGTDLNDEDTDGDGLLDGEDPLPLEPLCPPAIESFAAMAASSYAIVVTFMTGPSASDRVDFAIGSAFAVAPNWLATNAHVVLGILENRYPVERVVAVQSGTGRVITLVNAAVHPSFNNDPLESPDVGVIATASTLLDYLELAEANEIADLVAGDELALTGFPGDVNDLFEITPGETVPQATSLTGRVTALRSFDTTVVVTPENIDIVQHQLPTSPGTSGSPLVRCGKVVAIHNAGTVRIVISVDNDGNISAIRDPAASNNFGIHVKHLRRLIEFVDGGLIRFPIRPPDPEFSGVFDCNAFSLSGSFSHSLQLTVLGRGAVSGTSLWNNGTFSIFGSVDRFGNIAFSDNSTSFGFVGVDYAGSATPRKDGFAGLYVTGSGPGSPSQFGLWGCAER